VIAADQRQEQEGCQVKVTERLMTPDEPEACLESWVADEFGYLGLEFGPGGPFNSNVYYIDDYRPEVK